MYVSEVWGSRDCDLIESVHLLAMKQFQEVTRQVPNIFMYGDCGPHPLYNNAMIRIIEYWLKVVNMDDGRFPLKVY